jgi:2-polyprenyl-6-methoxyphenol hydroxylase-like FAD-dependent oxidoreductase
MQQEFKAAVVMGRPHSFRAGCALPSEHRIMQVALLGVMGEKAPKDEAGYLAYAASLPDPILYNLIKRCTPLTPVTHYAGTSNIIRCYDKMKLPGGLVVLGDAYQALNPVYGQGMTVAATSAVIIKTALAKALKKARTDESKRVNVTGTAFTRQFQKKLAATTAIAWDIATSDDLRYECTEFEGVSRPSKAMLKYLDATFVVAQRDIRTWEQIIEVSHVSSYCKPVGAPFKPAMCHDIVDCGCR